MPVLVLVAALLLGVPGTFRGTVVRGPERQHGWIYVAGRNDTLRKVDITQASVSYDPKVPTRLREKAPKKSLVEGAEVRVTAEPDNQGAWFATEIEILRVPSQERKPVTAAKTTSKPM